MQFNNSNIEMMELKKQIHCKLTYKDQIRRFLFCGTEFAELRGHVCNLLSLNDGFVLKYVDNESDLITLTSTDDLNLSLELSPKLLRLVVEPTTGPSLSLPPSLDHSSHLPFPHGPPSSPPLKFYSPLSGGCTPPTGGTYFPRQEYRHSRGEKCTQRIQGKLDYFKGLLAQTPPEDSRRPDLLNQIQRLEGRLARVNQWRERGGGFKHQQGGGGCHKKWKEEKKRKEKKNKQQLSPEAFEQVQTIKAQIGSLKPVLYQLKVTKKAKKNELDNALKSGIGDKESLWNEILKLKEAIVDNKKQIAALKDQIRSIHEAAKLSQ